MRPAAARPPRNGWLDRRQVQQGRRLYRAARRFQDVLLTGAALAVLWPAMAAVALAIWLDSPGGSPFFVQQRVGQNGRLFRLYKFRTMVPDAEARLEQVLPCNEMDGPVFKMQRDPRVTRLGRWLRRAGIDELPQLLNVLKGEMSLVGPRPALPREAERYTPYQRQRLYVKPGLTCLWQVQPDRNQIPFDRWVELDLEYIRRRSLRLDWVLIFKTFGAVGRMYGA
ncbi:multidrug MFS transporter [Faecalibacterium sp. An58]|uniref:sugar transferase n=1 Tax=Faecalibacterium sp. An58 TaxID=1965648 RepID=UPI000B3A7CD6|nr:sugar transferase [Faecalibacterium sp. An58]OUN72539.1 multidrug MFS transporter [Faecalibacterium sp. An58]